MKNNKITGYTLVELAVVVTIIGLLIGGVLKGQQMIYEARITETIEQVEGYKAALGLFKDKYENIPGDYSLATDRLQDCNVSTSCVNGDANGIVGVRTTGWGHVGDGDDSIGSENTQFWKHLALADLISGVVANASTPNFGETHPSSRFRGGFFLTDSCHASGTRTCGITFRIQPRTSGSYSSDDDNANSISPQHAAIIDDKLDDGHPGKGSVQAFGIPNAGNCKTHYDRTLTSSSCIIGFIQ